ncbi:reverse transcriptase domain-containing protein [Tanacetum coccineum]
MLVRLVSLSTNPVQHQLTKHIEIDIHFVRDFVAIAKVRVHVPSRFQYADIFTKGISTALFIEFRFSLNVRRLLLKMRGVLTPSIFAGSSSFDKADRTLSLFTGRSGSDFVAGSIRAGGDTDADLQEIYVPKWSVTKGFELNDGRSCANMIDHFTPPAFFKTVRGMEHGQLFTEFNVSAARNLSLSSQVRMRVEYNILEKRKWKSLSEEKNNLLQVKDKEIEELRSQLLQAKGESMEEHNGLFEQERSALKLKVTSLESIIAEKDRELSDLGTSSSSLRSQNQSLVNQVHELETSFAGLHEKLEMYEGSMK